jgi:thiamine-monophosphate kinase
VGAVVEATQVPIPPQVIEVAIRIGKAPLDLALKGGEDYHLLFTASPGKKQDIQHCFQQAYLPTPTCIGEIVPGAGVRLRWREEEVDISGTGFDHFPIPPP